jgi:aminoglycoside phosphotransferase (APT) family kinase protein
MLASQFPRWAHLPIEPLPSIGTVNAIYRLGDDLYVRLPRVGRWAADLERELRWLPRLAQHLPLAVPEPLAKGSPGDGYPFTWAVYRWLPGEPWTDHLVRDPSRAAADLAAFVGALQGIDTHGGPPSGRGTTLAMHDAEARRAIESLDGVVDPGTVTAAWEAALQAPVWDGRPVWTHGDLLPPNLLVHQGRLSGVIDFGIVGLGDPACDMIAAWSVLSGRAREVFRASLQVDDTTWERGRGWALSIALPIIPYYRNTNPAFVAMAIRMIDQILQAERT